jgi:hypothetical protein
MGRWTMGAVIALLCSTAVQAAAQATAPEWQPNGRWKEWGKSVVGVPALLDVGVATAIDQWRDEPPEWDEDGNGFAKRLASNAGRNGIEESVRHGLAAVMNRSVSYQRCACRSFDRRLRHALLESITDRGREGKRMVSFARIGGVFAGALAQDAWEPGDRGEILRVGARGLAFGVLGNLWREFVGWP